MAWNRAYHSHTLPRQKQEQVVTDASAALSVSSDTDDYEVNNEQKPSCPMEQEKLAVASSPYPLRCGSELDYVNTVTVTANQGSLTLPHHNRSATFSGMLTMDYQHKTLPSYINIDSGYSWLEGSRVHYERELENETTFNSAPGKDCRSVAQAVPIVALPRTAELVPEVIEKSHSYQNLPPLCSPSESFHMVNCEKKGTVHENISLVP